MNESNKITPVTNVPNSGTSTSNKDTKAGSLLKKIRETPPKGLFDSMLKQHGYDPKKTK